MIDPEKVYEGTPCKRAGHTLRWKNNRGCVTCSQEDWWKYHGLEYRERKRDQDRERYWNLSGVEYNRRLLRLRRQAALKRRKERQAVG